MQYGVKDCKAMCPLARLVKRSILHCRLVQYRLQQRAMHNISGDWKPCECVLNETPPNRWISLYEMISSGCSVVGTCRESFYEQNNILLGAVFSYKLSNIHTHKCQKEEHGVPDWNQLESGFLWIFAGCSCLIWPCSSIISSAQSLQSLCSHPSLRANTGILMDSIYWPAQAGWNKFKSLPCKFILALVLQGCWWLRI